jgi:hypothetical protein
MYRIQGSDNKEYGPIPAETIRQWIGERRLNEATPACLDGEGVWKTLGQFPEFAGVLAANSRPPAMAGNPDPMASLGADPDAARARALAMVQAPAMCLLIFALVSVVACLALGAMTLSGVDLNQGMMKLFKINPPAPSAGQEATQRQFARISGVANVTLGVVWNLTVALGAYRMRQLRSRGLAMTAAVLAIVPCFSVCCLASMPIGLWAVTTLGKPEVSPHFKP